MYTLREPIHRAESLFGGREATVCGDTRRTYSELAERVRRVAGLMSACTDPGDRVALWALNSDRYLELFIGIPCADRVIVPHNTRWAEPELRRRHGRRRCAAADLRPRPGRARRVVERVIRLDTGEYDELLAAAPELEPAVAPDTLAGLFYTGRHDRFVEGRDAHPRQLDGQRRAHPARPAAAGRRPLPDDGADVPRRRCVRRAGAAVGRRDEQHRPGVRPRRRPRPDRRASGSRAPSPCRRCWRRSSSARPPTPATCPACGGSPTARRQSPSRCSAAPPTCSAAS